MLPSNSTIKSILERFPYLNIDVSSHVAKTHPQLIFERENATIDSTVSLYSERIKDLTASWASLKAPNDDERFAIAISGLEEVINRISATIVAIEHCGRPLVERPGNAFDKHRKDEIRGLYDYVTGNWPDAPLDERISFSNISLLGLPPLPFETINYSNTIGIPTILARMMSRIEFVSGKREFDFHIYDAITRFPEIEKKVLEAKKLESVIVAGGTLSRVYVPSTEIRADASLSAIARAAMYRGRGRVSSIVNLLRLIWNQFGDEALIILHTGNVIESYALVGGCCYYYKAQIDQNDGMFGILAPSKPVFLSPAGEYKKKEWRRTIDKLSFEGAKDKVRLFRSAVISLESQKEDLRAEGAQRGAVAKAADNTLRRQVIYNLMSVLNGRMVRVAFDVWAPHMSRDRHGRIYNIAHALGGAGSAFIGPLKFGGALSQMRIWREIDGSYEFEEIRKYRAYRQALEAYLENDADTESSIMTNR